MRKFALSFAGLGFIPGAPGTYATVVALAIFYCGVRFHAPMWVFPALAVFFGLVLLVLGVPSGSGGGRSDPRWCVLDEFSGALVAVSFQPTHSPFMVAVVALVFFRFFDILKPPPVNLLERLPGAWGVLADDLAAGVLANVCILLLRLLVPQL